MEAGGGGEPVTPAGRFFLNPSMQQVINCIIGLKNPIDVPTIKLDVQNLIRSHPRFTSVVVKNEKGREEWRKVDKVNLDDHFVIVQEEEDDDDDEDFVNKYVAELTVSTPLDLNKPLWEIHILGSSKCLVIRLHHALGDGISLMSLFLSIFKRADNPSLPLTIPGSTTKITENDTKKKKKRSYSFSIVFSFLLGLWKLVLVVCYTSIFTLDMMVRMLWVKDEETPVRGGDGVELWPRLMSTATFELSDMKILKGAINGTINDVLVGIISLGLQRYLKTRTTTSLKSRKTLRMTGMVMVNTRKIPGVQDVKSMMEDKSKTRWGNNFGFILLPIYLRKNNNDVCDDPLEHVRRAKQMTDKKKLSLEAHLSYRSGSLIMSLLGPEVATKLNKKLICNTTFTLSNVAGPAEEALFAGNPITYIRTTSTALPHALTMHMVTYKGKADMQILAAKNIIPDPDVLAKCFQDALADMKTAALLHHANYSHQICKKEC